MIDKKAEFAKKLIGTKYDTTVSQNIIESILDGSHKLTESKNKQHKCVERIIPENETVIPSVCFSCHSTCEVLIYKDKNTGEILRVEGDPDSPQTRGMLCPKGLAAKQLVYNPKRLLKPLKRVGERGEGKWKEISWDEALDTVAEKLKEYKKNTDRRDLPCWKAQEEDGAECIRG